MIGLSIHPIDDKYQVEIIFYSIENKVTMLYDDRAIAKSVFDALQKELHLEVL